jgi:lipoprotein-anchoring transpeptidase ErfK/SrfK
MSVHVARGSVGIAVRRQRAIRKKQFIINYLPKQAKSARRSLGALKAISRVGLNLRGPSPDKSISQGDVMKTYSRLAALFALIAATAVGPAAAANPLEALFGPVRPQVRAHAYANPNDDGVREVRSDLRRQVVNYRTSEAPGTVIIDTPNTYLYLVLPGGKAVRYGIGVGRKGFTWSGVKSIERKAEWPDWTPPPEMIQRQPYLPRFVAGGPTNPLGARAMYLSGSVYRIHGTNAPTTIGEEVSSGCIRMLNEDVIDLYNRVQVGTKVVVLPMNGRMANRGAAAY